ncbi:MAG TPA: thioredoxin-like domain-containing protein [Balneolales bacterium]|nr:thioredoxin-like domain-containing protein [Balneolales bacterium]
MALIKKQAFPLFLIMLSLMFSSCQSKPANNLTQTAVNDSSKYVGKIHAPEFPKGMQWLNTDRPLSLKELRGKIVLLDFWTYGCINCYHVFPDLKRLEKEFPNTLVVIGVHSAKFKSSGETKNIKQAILRFGLDHPVVNDKDFKIWKSYAIRAWPSFVLIDPTGKIVGETSGEGIYDMMHNYISHMVKIFSKKGELNRKPLNLVPESEKSAQSVLYFPGKVLADGHGKRLFIADTDHNRIVVTSLDGRVKEVIGNGKSGLKNGTYQEAMFNQPQGMTLMGDTLYVADTGNHAIRAINLKTQSVSTLAGNGKQAEQFNQPGTGKKVSLNSPWAITHVDHELYVAMAGPHQIWKINPETAYAEPFAGSGAEGLSEGTRRQVPMAQPSGITTDGKYLYVAEPEASAVQKVGLGSDNKVTTIVGKGLFVFGDKDGKEGSQVLLQHDLGIALWQGKLIVADTYNNKIKEIDPNTGKTTTLFGGKEGYKDGVGKNALFDEPGGVSVLGNWLYIADTNNHLIRKANLNTHKVETLTLTNLKKMELHTEKEESPGKIVLLKTQDVHSGPVQISLNIQLPKGYKFNTDASNRFILKTAKGQKIFQGKKVAELNKPAFPHHIDVNLKGITNDTLYVDTYAYFCNDKTLDLCLYQGIRYKIPLQITSSGSKTIKIEPTLKTELY